MTLRHLTIKTKLIAGFAPMLKTQCDSLRPMASGMRKHERARRWMRDDPAQAA